MQHENYCRSPKKKKTHIIQYTWCCGGGIPSLNVRMQMVCTLIGTFCKYATCIMRSLKRCSRCYWSAVDFDGRATVVQVGWRRWCLEDCWECCTEVRSMRCAVQWSPMEPESWSGWFPLKSSPACSYRWLHCDLQNVPREHANCTAGTVRANWSEASSLLIGELNCVFSVTAFRWTQVKTLLATIHVAFVGCHGNPVYRAVTWIPICVSVTWSPVFPTCGRFPWEAPTMSMLWTYKNILCKTICMR
jgi:hypothetical protein